MPTTEAKVVAHYCRKYAAEEGLRLREADWPPSAVQFLIGMVDQLEAVRPSLPAHTQDDAKVRARLPRRRGSHGTQSNPVGRRHGRSASSRTSACASSSVPTTRIAQEMRPSACRGRPRALRLGLRRQRDRVPAAGRRRGASTWPPTSSRCSRSSQSSTSRCERAHPCGARRHPDPDSHLARQVSEMRRYALWKCAEIRRALDEGRRPDPGPPGWDPEVRRVSARDAREQQGGSLVPRTPTAG